jgi:hypothetical protein
MRLLHWPSYIMSNDWCGNCSRGKLHKYLHMYTGTRLVPLHSSKSKAPYPLKAIGLCLNLNLTYINRPNLGLKKSPNK